MPDTPNVTRAVAAARLGLSKSGIRHLEASGTLQPLKRKRRNGPVLYSAEAVEKLAATKVPPADDHVEEMQPEAIPDGDEVETQPPPTDSQVPAPETSRAPAPRNDEETEAFIVGDLDAGKPMTAICAERRVALGRVRAVHQEWIEARREDENAKPTPNAVAALQAQLGKEIEDRFKLLKADLDKRLAPFVDTNVLNELAHSFNDVTTELRANIAALKTPPIPSASAIRLVPLSAEADPQKPDSAK
jgi:hypothetical protein